MTASRLSSVDLTASGGLRVGGAESPLGASMREAPLKAESQNDRLRHIDTLRGAAAIQVVLSHAMLAFSPGMIFAIPFSGDFFGYLISSPLHFASDGASAVCIFFTLSGYVLTPLFANSKASAERLALSRFVRLGLPALAACALAAVLYRLLGSYSHRAGVLLNSRWMTENWQPFSDLWFVKDALVNGLLLGFRGDSILEWFGFPASDLPTLSDSYLAPLWTLSIEFYGSLLVLVVTKSNSWRLVGIAAVLLSRTYLLCFLIGHVAARWRLGEGRPMAPWPIAAALALLGVAICMTSHYWTPEVVLKFCTISPQILPPCPTADMAYVMRIYGASLFTIALLQCEPVRAVLNHRRLSLLGRLSFPIYLTHWPVVVGIGCFLLVTLAPWLGLRAAHGLALVASLGLSVGAAMAFEPVDRLALRVSRALRDFRSASGAPGGSVGSK